MKNTVVKKVNQKYWSKVYHKKNSQLLSLYLSLILHFIVLTLLKKNKTSKGINMMNEKIYMEHELNIFKNLKMLNLE